MPAEWRPGLIASPGSELADPIFAGKGRLAGFFLALFGLALLRITVGYVAVPVAWLGAASTFATVAFMAIPILALFVGAGHRWSFVQALLMIAIGVALQFGISRILPSFESPVLQGILFAFAQTGLVCWCLGAGAALACALRDRNMILPISVFLALFDMWLVFAPEGPVGKIARGGQEKLAAIAYTIPKIVATNAAPEEVPKGFAHPSAFVGPADLLFLGMFFVALYRFRMRPVATFKAMVPVLIAYLAIVLCFPNVWIGPIRLAALPALLPIGLVVLIVNRREFVLTKDEKLITVLIAAIGIPFVAWRIAVTQPAPEEEVAPPLQVVEMPFSPWPEEGVPTPNPWQVYRF